MGYVLDRRQWMKTSAMVLAGLMAGPGLEVLQEKTDDLIMLHNNESPFGISPNARNAIIAGIDLSNRYPHRRYYRLTDLIAERENVPPDHIILGAGSTEVMVTLIHYAQTKGEILVGDPTYFDFLYYANQAGCHLRKIRLNDDFEHDLETTENQVTPKTGLVYICNPINPTGTITPRDKLRPFCEQVSKQALVVVDEAYHEYASEEDGAYSSMVDLVRTGSDIIVTRTFSKIFGLAGLRIGYGIGHPDTLAKLEKLSRNFAPVSWLSLQAAIASYRDRTFIQKIKEKNRQMRQYLRQELKKMGFLCVPSRTNFVLFQIDRDARDVTERLAESKILVRPFAFHDRQWIRVSCGTKQELRAFLSTLASVLYRSQDRTRD